MAWPKLASRIPETRDPGDNTGGGGFAEILQWMLDDGKLPVAKPRARKGPLNDPGYESGFDPEADSIHESSDLMDLLPVEKAPMLAVKGAGALKLGAMKGLPMVAGVVKGSKAGKKAIMATEGFAHGLQRWLSGGDHASRDLVAKLAKDMDPKTRQEMLRRVAGNTQTRRNPVTNSVEYKLYRGDVDPKDPSKGPYWEKDAPAFADRNAISWSTSPYEASSLKPHMGKLHEAWIPEENVAVYPNYFGRPSGEYNSSTMQHDYSLGKLPNSFRHEMEVITSGQNSKMLRDKYKDASEVKPLVKTLDQEINERAKGLKNKKDGFGTALGHGIAPPVHQSIRERADPRPIFRATEKPLIDHEDLLKNGRSKGLDDMAARWAPDNEWSALKKSQNRLDLERATFSDTHMKKYGKPYFGNDIAEELWKKETQKATAAAKVPLEDYVKKEHPLHYSWAMNDPDPGNQVYLLSKLAADDSNSPSLVKAWAQAKQLSLEAELFKHPDSGISFD